jgi:hypothetical protein
LPRQVQDHIADARGRVALGDRAGGAPHGGEPLRIGEEFARRFKNSLPQSLPLGKDERRAAPAEQRAFFS